MKVSAILSLAALVGSSLAVAIPNGGEDYSCYKCEYRQDDCGNKYGGYDTPKSRHPGSDVLPHPRAYTDQHVKSARTIPAATSSKNTSPSHTARQRSAIAARTRRTTVGTSMEGE